MASADVEIIGHMVLAGVVDESDGDAVCDAAAEQLFDWVTSMDLQIGDEVVIIRGRNAP